MILLEELKNKLKNELNLQGDTTPCGFSEDYTEDDYWEEDTEYSPDLMSFSDNNVVKNFYKRLLQEPEKVKQIEKLIAKGDDFRKYFSKEEYIKEFAKMHRTDPDRFYEILRKEEMFLNTCFRVFGYNNVMITLDPKKLINDIKKMFPDENI